MRSQTRSCWPSGADGSNRTSSSTPRAWYPGGAPPAGSAAACYLPSVSTARINLADPDFEPDDEQLQGLSARAFAGLGEAKRRRDEALRVAIAAARHAARGSLRAAPAGQADASATGAPCDAILAAAAANP